LNGWTQKIEDIIQRSNHKGDYNVTILTKLLKEIKSDDALEKIRILCDQIFEQEKKNIEHILILPKGPNLFLVLEVPGRLKGEISFLALERESKDLYLAVLFVTTVKELQKNDPPSIKRQKVWEINDHRPEQILTGYAKYYKFLRGE
jgi:hypothetical protein